jgi:ankyrin repeat protein
MKIRSYVLNGLMLLLVLARGVNGYSGPDSSWFEAARTGETDRLLSLISSGADPNALDADGRTALILAAMHGKVETVKLLMTKGANVNVRDSKGETAASYAKKIGYTNVVAILAARDAGALTEDLVGAVGKGSTSQEVEALCRQGANANMQTADGFTVLMKACANPRNDVNVINVLLANGADVNARSKPNYELLPSGAPEGLTALMLAAEKDDAAVLEALIKRGANVNAASNIGSTALMRAILYDNLPAVKLLLDNGASPNITLRPISGFLRSGFISPLRLAMREAPEDPSLIDNIDQTDPAFALAFGRGRIVNWQKMLKQDEPWPGFRAKIEAGIAPYKKIYKKAMDDTPLITAKADDAVIRLLEGKGAVKDPELLNSDLQKAVSDGDAEMVAALLEKGGNPNLGDSEVALLSGPVSKGRRNIPVARVLLEKGADPDARSIETVGTVLFDAVMVGDLEMTKLLLEHHANPNFDTRWGTPLYVAVTKGMREIADLLQQFGASSPTKAEVATLLAQAEINGSREKQAKEALLRRLTPEGLRASKRQEWRQLIRAAYQLPVGVLPQMVKTSDWFRIAGQPDRSETVGDRIYWYYRCSDGVMQMVISRQHVETMGVIVTEELNDRGE